MLKGVFIVQCCFMSTETVRTIRDETVYRNSRDYWGRDAQDDHTDFHTAPELSKGVLLHTFKDSTPPPYKDYCRQAERGDDTAVSTTTTVNRHSETCHKINVSPCSASCSEGEKKRRAQKLDPEGFLQ